MLPTTSDTQKLLEQAKHGERGAVERLLARHREPLRRMIGLRLDPALARRLDASDVTQDVLVEANRRLTDYLQHPTMPFHLWLRHIAKDHIIDAHRKHRKAQRRSVDREQPMAPAPLAGESSAELVAQFLDRELTPASAAIRQELQRRLEKAITTLDEHDREIILMKVHEQLPNEEVADLLGLSEAATSMRYLRAVRRLRGILLPQGDDATRGPDCSDE